MTDSIHVSEFIKYVTYPEDVAIAILTNDVLNMHIREDNIESYTSIEDGNKFKLTVVLNKQLRVSEDGITYDGKIGLIYDKLDASLVFPNGFYTHKIPGNDFNIQSMLVLLKKHTGMIIKESDCQLIEENGLVFIEFKSTSLFWKGRIQLKSMEDIEYHVLEE